MDQNIEEPEFQQLVVSPVLDTFPIVPQPLYFNPAAQQFPGYPGFWETVMPNQILPEKLKSSGSDSPLEILDPPVKSPSEANEYDLEPTEEDFDKMRLLDPKAFVYETVLLSDCDSTMKRKVLYNQAMNNHYKKYSEKIEDIYKKYLMRKPNNETTKDSTKIKQRIHKKILEKDYILMELKTDENFDRIVRCDELIAVSGIDILSREDAKFFQNYKKKFIDIWRFLSDQERQAFGDRYNENMRLYRRKDYFNSRKRKGSRISDG